MTEDFKYNASSLVLPLVYEYKTKFDNQFESSWNSKIESGCFRYRLDDLGTKYLPGKYQFIIQLNEKRATQRRKPQDVTDISMQFDTEKFHFGKVPVYEVMFRIETLDWGIPKPENREEKYTHAMIINVSPIESFHSLLVPNIDLCYPQVLNFEALRAAVEVILLSGDNCLRMGFNSLGAFASVNHLHFHLYHLRRELFLETVAVNQLHGSCYELTSFPSEGFAFEILALEDICNQVRAIMILIEFLMEKKIPHNIFLTRGLPFSKQELETSGYKSLRIYVWARKPYFGSKDDSGFNPAVCELSGHIPVKDKKTYDTLTEDEVIKCLKNVCHDVFVSIRDSVKTLYTNKF